MPEFPDFDEAGVYDDFADLCVDAGCEDTKITYMGKTMTCGRWAEYLGIDITMFYHRLYKYRAHALGVRTTAFGLDKLFHEGRL